jgi:hypothetical protein
MDDFPDDAPVPSFGPRMRCSRCGKLGGTAVPNWIEPADRLPGRRPAMMLWRVAACLLVTRRSAAAAAGVGLLRGIGAGAPRGSDNGDDPPQR